jgi:hypothetical protein
MRLSGRIVATYLRGRRVYEAPVPGSSAANSNPFGLDLPGIVAKPGCGRFLTWGYQ